MIVEKRDFISIVKQDLNDTADMKVHKFPHFNKEIMLAYLKSVCEEERIIKEIINHLVKCDSEREFKDYLLSLPHCHQINQVGEFAALLLDGNVIIYTDPDIFVLPVNKKLNVQLNTATVEMSVQGPQNAFTEDLDTNLLILRKRYPTSNLTFEMSKIGTISKTKLAIIYDAQFVDTEVLEEIRKKLTSINVDIIQAVGQLQNYLNRKKKTLFPTMMISERPDRCVFNLAQGKIVLILDGTPFTLSAPALFFDFISAMDDMYHSYWVTRILVFLRYTGLFITVTLPGFYIAVTSYNPEILRSQLALTIAGSRAAVPYPSFIEVILMLIAVEMLIEASIRLPKAIGPTATTVGGLILGQAVQQAQLVSSIMIIITAFVAISNFVIPINAMSFAMRMVRYPLIIGATFFGLIGLIITSMVFLCYLVNLRSFGKPYLALYWGTAPRIEHLQELRKEDRT